MLEKILKTIYTKSNYFPGDSVCILLQILYFYLTMSFLPSATAVQEVVKVSCFNLCVLVLEQAPPACVKAASQLYRSPGALASCNVGGLLRCWCVHLLLSPACQLLGAGLLQQGGGGELM